MGSVTYPRGRLPRRVYWFRRGLVLGAALLLVFGISRLVGGTGEDDPGSAIEASPSSARQAADAPVTMGPVAPSKKLRLKAQVPLLPPSGDCRDDEVSVLPSVPQAWVGGEIVIQLRLGGTQPACTFKVSPETIAVKITSGKDRIWSSQECPRSIRETEVVVRSGQPVQVPVVWSGRRSDAQCSPGTDWALPGFYHVHAAALGSTPTDVQFEVTQAAARVVTRTPKPRPSASASATPTAKASPQRAASPKASPTAKPSRRP